MSPTSGHCWRYAAAKAKHKAEPGPEPEHEREHWMTCFSTFVTMVGVKGVFVEFVLPLEAKGFISCQVENQEKLLVPDGHRE